MNVPTANIVVAFNKEVMERLFSSGATYKSLVAKLSEGLDNALLFSNTGNSNFISLEHTQNLGGGFKITLSFIDPKNEFEKRFFTDNAAEVIERYSSPSSEKTDGFVTDKPDDVEQSQEEYEKQYISQFKRELEETIGEREIYVAYGTGNNLDLWSGPHRTVLTAADISVNGPRKITLTLTPTPNALKLNQRRGAYNEQVNLNLLGLKMRFAGESQEIDFFSDKSYDPGRYLKDKSDVINFRSLAAEDRELLTDLGFKEVSDKIEKFDFHAMVVDAIRSYIQKATSNKNVIVLLPNLNVICAQTINDKAKKYKLIKGLDPRVGAVPETSITPGIKGVRLDRVSGLYAEKSNELGSNKMFVESTLQSFGLRMHSGDRAAKLEKRTEPNGLIPHAANERFPSAASAVDNYFEERYFTAVLDKTDRQLPDHMGVLNKVFDKIKKMSNDTYKMSTIVYLTETDTRILNEWTPVEGSNGKYTFGGYDKFDGNTAIIVGDLSLIQDYLYAGVNLEKKEQDIASLKRQASEASVREVAQEFRDIQFELNQQSEAITEEERRARAEAPRSTDYLRAAALQIPLYPLDKDVLTSKAYNFRMKSLLNPVLKGSGAFGDISYLPDEFSYSNTDFDDTQKKYIEENGIPVFRYNTQNPNTLSLNFKFAPIYLGNLKAGFQKEIEKLSSAVAEGILPTGIGSFPIRDRGAAIAYAFMKGFTQGLGDKDKKKIMDQLALSISPELAESLKLNSPDAVADFTALYVSELKKKNLHGLVLVEQELPGSPQTILTDFTEDMFRKAYQMSITTLPLFHVSKTASIGSPCIFFGQDQPITQTVRPRSLALNKFFSGLYKIMGYKHTITTGEAVSEFKLVKNAPKFKVEK